MTSKWRLSVIVFLALLLMSCSKSDKSAKTKTYVAASPKTGEVATVIDEVFMFPKSDISNPFGNQKSSCSIIYNPYEDQYYFFQWNRWNYEKGSVLGGAVEGDVSATQDVLARINTIEGNLDNRKLISDYAISDIMYDSGNIFYVADGVLNSLGQETDIFDLYGGDERLDRFAVSDNILYYTISGQSGLWYMPTNIPQSEPKQIIKEDVFDFQIIEEKIFFSNKDGIFLLTKNEPERILEKHGISNFIVDGVVLFKDAGGSLFRADKNEQIAEDVLWYNVLGDSVIYNTSIGLYKYDLVKSSNEQIIEFNENSQDNLDIVSFAVYNDKIFLDIRQQWIPPEPVNSIYVYDLNDKSLKPLISVKIEEFQTYNCIEMGYELTYPIGYVIQFDPASYFSGQTLFVDPVTGVCIRVMNHGYFYGIDSTLPNGTKIVTDEGVIGYYNVTQTEKGFRFSCTIVNGYRFVADCGIDNVDDTKAIFIKMIKSLKVCEQ